MFQTQPYRVLNQIKHNSRQLVDEFKLSLYKINTPRHMLKEKEKIKMNNKIIDANHKINIQQKQKMKYKKEFEPPLIKIWNMQFEKIIKMDRKKNLPFQSTNKILRILEIYPEIKYKVSFFVYPSAEYQAMNITYKQLIQRFLKINYHYITQNINKKSIVSDIFKKLCSCLKNIETSPVYSTGRCIEETISKIFKQNDMVYITNQNIKSPQQITRERIYEQKFELYRKMMEQQQNESNGQYQSANKLDQKQGSILKQIINQSFLSELHKKDTFSEEWVNMIKQKQKNGYQELQKTKIHSNFSSFKRFSKDKKLDNVLDSIQKFKKQSQYMIKMLQDRLSY